MSPEAMALLAAISYAVFTVYGWLGVQYSTIVFLRRREEINRAHDRRGGLCRRRLGGHRSG